MTNRLFQGYPCGGPGEPCNSIQTPYFRPSAAVTRAAAAKVDSKARLYHKGVAGYPNLIPYRGSPSYHYGAAYPNNPVDYSSLPSGEFAPYSYDYGQYATARVTDLSWNTDSAYWLKYDPNSGPTAIEMGFAIDPGGSHTCAGGSWSYSITTTLPNVTLTNGYICGRRAFFDRSQIQTFQTYALQLYSGQTGNPNSRIQLYQLQETCQPACGGDMTKADMLGHICLAWGFNIGLYRCPTNP